MGAGATPSSTLCSILESKWLSKSKRLLHGHMHQNKPAAMQNLETKEFSLLQKKLAKASEGGI